MVWTKVVLEGNPTGGAEGVMMSLNVQEVLLALDAVRVYAKGVVVLSTHPTGSAPVTIRPVASTVGLTAGSFDVTA